MNSDYTSKPSYHDSVVKLLEFYDKSPSKSDEILSAQFILSSKNRPFRRVCQFIFLTVLRNKLLIDHILTNLLKRKPSTKIFAILRAASAEILSSEPEKLPKIIHSWVDFTKKNCSKPEAGFVNAVLRKIYNSYDSLKKSATSAKDFSVFYSHPLWLVEKWISNFGFEKTIEILKNNSIASEVFLRKSPSQEADKLFSKYEEFLSPTKFPNFFSLKSGHWNDIPDLINSQHFYIQDPSTSFAPKMLDPNPKEFILDLCAAPGGKSRLIADILLAKVNAKNSTFSKDDLASTVLVSVDTGKFRLQPLIENMAKIDFLKSYIIDCDIIKENLLEKLESQKLPTLFDSIFIDAPCSNTGVLRRRPDAKYRITPDDISNCSIIQKDMLDLAVKFLKVGGKLVFSTCSIEPEEDSLNAKSFIERNPSFELIESKVILPALQNDGGSAFLFKKIS